MPRNIVSLFKRFGRQVFQNRTTSSCKPLLARPRPNYINLKTELINDNIGTRQKLLLLLGGILLILIVINFSKFYFASIEYQKGIKSSRFWFSHNDFLGFSIITIIIILPIIAFSKIVRRLIIDTDENTLEVEYINRFKIRPITKTVKLAETIIQVTEYKPKDRNYQKNDNIIYTLYLTNPNFGLLKVSGQDFQNINDVAKLFQSIKDDMVINTRQRRINKKKKPSH